MAVNQAEQSNLYAPPQTRLESRPVDECWREGKIVVIPVGGDLPHRCVHCNEAAEQPIKTRKVYWHHPALYLLILVAILIYAVVAFAVRRKAEISPGLCARHTRRRNFFLAFGWGGFALSVVLICSVGVIGDMGSGLGFLLLFVSIAAGMLGSRIVTASRISKQEIRLRGCGKPFLNSLPTQP